MADSPSSKRPFMCPICHGVGVMSGGYFSRTGDCLFWSQDRTFPEAMVPLDELPMGCGRFDYPADPRAEHACGVTVLP